MWRFTPNMLRSVAETPCYDFIIANTTARMNENDLSAFHYMKNPNKFICHVKTFIASFFEQKISLKWTKFNFCYVRISWNIVWQFFKLLFWIKIKMVNKFTIFYVVEQFTECRDRGQVISWLSYLVVRGNEICTRSLDIIMMSRCDTVQLFSSRRILGSHFSLWCSLSGVFPSFFYFPGISVECR